MNTAPYAWLSGTFNGCRAADVRRGRGTQRSRSEWSPCGSHKATRGQGAQTHGDGRRRPRAGGAACSGPQLPAQDCELHGSHADAGPRAGGLTTIIANALPEHHGTQGPRDPGPARRGRVSTTVSTTALVTAGPVLDYAPPSSGAEGEELSLLG